MATEDPFAGKAEWFDAGYRDSSHGMVRLDLVLERLLERLPPPPAAVLDAGGGTGAFAIPLAARGYDVTLVDRSWEWLDVAGGKAEESRVRLRLVQGAMQEVGSLLDGQSFDAILCHTVLLYLDDPGTALEQLRTLARPGAVLSILEKNRDGLPLRPGFAGDYAEALRVLDDPVAAGRLGVPNRARSVGELRSLLLAAGWRSEDWIGVRLFSDMVLTLDEDRYADLLALDRVAGSREPYRRLARLIHLLARPLPDSPESLEMIQARSFAAASATTLDSWPPHKALSGPELAAFLEEPRYAAVTTTRAGGRPHATMTAYRVRDGRLWLPAVSGAVRLRNLAHEPSATVLVAEGGGEEHVVVMVEGDAVVHDDPQAILSAWLQDEWRRAYGTVLDWAGRIIELVPSKVLSYAATPRS
ncbi:MAG TPA: methyltransferase domain-containing protein [Actinomycetota bacterium]